MDSTSQLPLQCWNTRAISKIASKIGKPICINNVTKERKRISYARVLVEIDTSVAPIEVFDVKLPSRITYAQYVFYENLPKFCNYCFMFGHLRDNCRNLHPKDDTGTKHSEDAKQKSVNNPENQKNSLIGESPISQNQSLNQQGLHKHTKKNVVSHDEGDILLGVELQVVGREHSVNLNQNQEGLNMHSGENAESYVEGDNLIGD